MAASESERDQKRIEADLAEIREAILNGQTEEANKRLLGVSCNCGPGMTYSQELGDLFIELGFPAMAGRYWYLLENKTDRMIAACQEFEHSLGNDPGLIAWCFVNPLLLSPFAKSKLKELLDREQGIRREYQYGWKPPKTRLRDQLALLGCGIMAAIIVSVLIVGVASIASWFR